MRILYAAYRHNPYDPQAASGADFNFLAAMQNAGFEVSVCGPIKDPAFLAERALMKIHRVLSNRNYAKFPISLAWKASNVVNKAEATIRPDVVFTMFPPNLVFYRGSAPCVYRLDTCFWGWNEQYPTFSKLAMALLIWQERRVFAKCARIITHSQWTRDILVSRYGVSPNKIEVFANPSALPYNVLSNAQRPGKRETSPLELLLVGRDHHRKGIDIATEIVQLLNAEGMTSRLTVCGTKGSDTDLVRFVGPYRKNLPDELDSYTQLYKNAHLLLHPARFDPSPIVTAEAAAFGTPTITNDTGGVGSSVEDGVSGIVLPKGSPPEAYVKAITELMANPARYYALCETTRTRYERELNWDVAGKQVARILRDVVDEAKPQRGRL